MQCLRAALSTYFHTRLFCVGPIGMATVHTRLATDCYLHTTPMQRLNMSSKRNLHNGYPLSRYTCSSSCIFLFRLFVAGHFLFFFFPFLVFVAVRFSFGCLAGNAVHPLIFFFHSDLRKGHNLFLTICFIACLNVRCGNALCLLLE